MSANTCNHHWIANSGRGGEPEFRLNRTMSELPLMHVLCSKCNDRTWLTREQWDALEETMSANTPLTALMLVLGEYRDLWLICHELNPRPPKDGELTKLGYVRGKLFALIDKALPEAAAELERRSGADDQIANLATMVRRLARQLRIVLPSDQDHTLIGQAYGLLRKYGLQGSPLRDEYTEGASPPAQSSFCWLIERGQPEQQEPTLWWRGLYISGIPYMGRWTETANEAVRFRTREDAETRIQTEHLTLCRAVEHGFLLPAQDSPPGVVELCEMQSRLTPSSAPAEPQEEPAIVQVWRDTKAGGMVVPYIDSLHALLREMEKEHDREALRKDAARYRYWRDNHGWTGYFDDGLTNSDAPQDIDAAVDKRIAALSGQEGER